MTSAGEADFVAGDATAIALPTHSRALREAGPDFLTRAFHAFGSLSADNAVTRIVDVAPCHGGNSGAKLFLSVEYARADPALHTELFVKLSRDFADPFRDRRRYELEAEVRLAALSRLPAFPVAVARPYFADFHHESGGGILITQQIGFGRNGIEPSLSKCMDHTLPNALEHYRATVTALARLAGAQKAGRLSPEVEQLFPWDERAAAAALPIPWGADEMRGKVAAIGALIAGSPQLFPSAVTAPGFIARLEREALALLRHEAQVRRFLHADSRFIALTHWNTNLDNAWFWRDADGVLQCGLLDWGMVRQMNLAYGLWGGLSAADGAMLEAHLEDLLALFAGKYAAHGGPDLPLGELALHFDMSLALLGLSLMFDFPALVAARLPRQPRHPGRTIQSSSAIRSCAASSTSPPISSTCGRGAISARAWRGCLRRMPARSSFAKNRKGEPRMFLKGHYQNAYVTHDLQKAMAMIEQRYGLNDWIKFDMELPVKTPEGDRTLAVKVACAWAGWLQIELIEPVSGAVEPYLPYLPADKNDASPRFHHISLRRDDYDAMQAEIGQLGLPFVCEGGIPDLLYTYLDGRGTFGHYVEYVWASEAGWKMIGWPEGRPAI